MRHRVLPVLQLVRLPNVITAAADSLAGWLLVGGGLDETSRWLPLAGASMCLYAAGMALNDYLDLEVDRLERPGRPLASGRLSPALAAGIGWGGVGLGLALAVTVAGGASATFLVALTLTLAILGYDVGLKRTPFGPQVMGSCRGLNMLLGMSAADGLGGSIAWMAAAAFALFVSGITWISRSEAFGGERKNVVRGAAIEGVALAVLALVILAGGKFPDPVESRSWFPLGGLAVLACVATFVGRAASAAVREPTPTLIQRAVKTSLMTLVWIDVALVLAVRGPGPALAVAVLWPPSFLLARWLYAT